MKKNNKFISKYKKDGYFITQNLFKNEDIFNLRKDLDEEFKCFKGGARLGIEKIKNLSLTEKIIKIFSSYEIKNIAGEVEKNFLKKTYILPLFEIDKNLHVNPKKSYAWHKDCGGETKYQYCNNIIKDKTYFFPKVGIYLQKNEEFGGGIDIIKKSHKKTIIGKVKIINYMLMNIVWKYFKNFYLKIYKKNFYMFFLGAKKLNPEVGCAVIFDSRLIHRGSPIGKSKFNEVNFIEDTNHAWVPEKKSKYSFYCQMGTFDSTDSYFYVV